MHYKEVKAILSRQNGMNLYRGCTHGCIYCDSRSKCYRMDHDFEDIEVKLRADEILEHTLKRKRTKSMISTGSMTDPYVPIEEELQITRRCLNQIERFDFLNPCERIYSNGNQVCNGYIAINNGEI